MPAYQKSLKLQSHEACKICKTYKNNYSCCTKKLYHNVSWLRQSKSWLIVNVPTCISDILLFNIKGLNEKYNAIYFNLRHFPLPPVNLTTCWVNTVTACQERSRHGWENSIQMYTQSKVQESSGISFEHKVLHCRLKLKTRDSRRNIPQYVKTKNQQQCKCVYY